MAAKKRISHDRGIKITKLREDGYSLQEIATKLKCNRSIVARTLARQKETGTMDDESGKNLVELLAVQGQQGEG